MTNDLLQAIIEELKRLPRYNISGYEDNRGDKVEVGGGGIEIIKDGNGDWINANDIDELLDRRQRGH